MTTLDTLMERNKEFAAQQSAANLALRRIWCTLSFFSSGRRVSGGEKKQGRHMPGASKKRNLRLSLRVFSAYCMEETHGEPPPGHLDVSKPCLLTPEK